MARFFKKKTEFKPLPERELRHLRPDPFVASKRVVSLDPQSFDKYITARNAALIMFYNPYKKECENTAKHFAKAAKKSKFPTHGFAALDCNQHTQFCCQENISVLPYFKLFAFGRGVANFFYSTQYQYHDMKKWMQGVPKTDPFRESEMAAAQEQYVEEPPDKSLYDPLTASPYVYKSPGRMEESTFAFPNTGSPYVYKSPGVEASIFDYPDTILESYPAPIPEDKEISRIRYPGYDYSKLTPRTPAQYPREYYAPELEDTRGYYQDSSMQDTIKYSARPPEHSIIYSEPEVEETIAVYHPPAKHSIVFPEPPAKDSRTYYQPTNDYSKKYDDIPGPLDSGDYYPESRVAPSHDTHIYQIKPVEKPCMLPEPESRYETKDYVDEEPRSVKDLIRYYEKTLYKSKT